MKTFKVTIDITTEHWTLNEMQRAAEDLCLIKFKDAQVVSIEDITVKGEKDAESN